MTPSRRSCQYYTLPISRRILVRLKRLLVHQEPLVMSKSPPRIELRWEFRKHSFDIQPESKTWTILLPISTKRWPHSRGQLSRLTPKDLFPLDQRCITVAQGSPAFCGG